MTKQTSTPVQQDAPKLSETEQKLLKQIQAQAPAQPSLIKYLSTSVCGFLW